jgi:predicted HAD superfamily Cof-like phosphohydrolase
MTEEKSLRSLKQLMADYPCNQCWGDEILCIGQPNVCSKVEEIKAWHEELEKWRDEAAASPLEMVRDFHRHCNFTINDSPTLIGKDLFKWRNALLREEVDELESAFNEGNLVKIADALADILYITYGTAVASGIPLEQVFREVHRSNMTKLPSSERDGKAQKGKDYSSPNLLKVFGAVGNEKKMSIKERLKRLAFQVDYFDSDQVVMVVTLTDVEELLDEATDTFPNSDLPNYENDDWPSNYLDDIRIWKTKVFGAGSGSKKRQDYLVLRAEPGNRIEIPITREQAQFISSNWQILKLKACYFTEGEGGDADGKEGSRRKEDSEK